MNPKLAKKIRSLKQRMKVKISQADGSSLKGGTQVVNTSFKFLVQENHLSIDGLLDFSFDAEVLDIGQREMIIGLSWLQENDFCIDIVKRRIWRQSDNLNIQCRERKIPPVEIMGANDYFAANKPVMIINIATRYAVYTKLWSSNQANKLPLHTEFDHPIMFKHHKARPLHKNYFRVMTRAPSIRARHCVLSVTCIGTPSY